MSFIILPNELLILIFNKLKPIEALKCRQLNHRLNILMPQIVKEQFSKSDVFEHVPNELWPLLNNNIALSGSSLLQFLIGEKYEEYDIDLFTSLELHELAPIDNVIRNNGFRRLELFVPNKFCSYRDVCDFIINYTNDETKQKIQIIVFYSDVKNQIMQFDYKCVQNMYNGSEFYINYNTLYYKRVIKKIKKDNKYSININRVFIDRLNKYKNRGFKFNITMEETNDIPTSSIYTYKTSRQDLDSVKSTDSLDLLKFEILKFTIWKD